MHLVDLGSKVVLLPLQKYPTVSDLLYPHIYLDLHITDPAGNMSGAHERLQGRSNGEDSLGGEATVFASCRADLASPPSACLPLKPEPQSPSPSEPLELLTQVLLIEMVEQRDWQANGNRSDGN